MSERTTIGGTTYESIGSSSSNLLLKCNGTARIQWGNRLIDLIKNGKIASGDSSTQIYVISDESEIKSDGIYVLNTEKSLRLLIYKDDEQYDITSADLYISAKTKQDITVEQRQQALENIGIYYNTLEEVQQAGIQNGLVYVLSDQNLYTIRDGIVSEFEAKLKTVTVEKEQQEGEVIKSTVSISLNVSDTDYLVVSKGQILIHYPLRVKNSASIESEEASDTAGYRLYIDSAGSHLDVDYLNVRSGLLTQDYIEIEYEDFYALVQKTELQEHKWYLITDYQNPWRLAQGASTPRPILVQALTKASIYPEGKLFKDQRVKITYDPTYREEIKVEREQKESDDSQSEIVVTKIKARGKITQMIDANNNKANFDFLDYTTTEDASIVLHASVEDASLDASIFPVNSYNNTLIVTNLRGITLSDGYFSNTEGSQINFPFVDKIFTEPDNTSNEDEAPDPEDVIPEVIDPPEVSEEDSKIDEEESDNEGSETVEEVTTMEMHDNIINCSGLILNPSCKNFSNNIITCTGSLSLGEMCQQFSDNNVVSSGSITLAPTCVYFVKNTIGGITTDMDFLNNITNSKFGILDHVIIEPELNRVSFNNLSYCHFESDDGYTILENVSCNSNLIGTENTDETIIFNFEKYPLLYSIGSDKIIYGTNASDVQVVVSKEQTFFRGMIVMHAGNISVPEGWAICDGETYTWDGVSTTTPNLIGRFIKATNALPGPGNAETLRLTEDHLPEHFHPHVAHSHTVSGIVTIEGEGSLVDEKAKDTTTINFSGNTNAVISTESKQTWANNPIQIAPEYYALVFIMKL